MQLPDIVVKALGWLAFHFTKLQPFIPTYIHLVVSALLPIYAGAHASLQRPSSAAKAKKKGKDGESDDEDEDEDEDYHEMEGLSAKDAIMLPILSGCTLAGLYFLIKWLKNPEILSKILNWYFALFSIFAVTGMICDGLGLLHSLLFPDHYLDQGALFHVDHKKKLALSKRSTGQKRISPLPGMLSRINLPKSLLRLAWFLYILPSKPLFIIKAHIHRVFSMSLSLGIHDVEGLIVAVFSVIYYNFYSKPWWLTNLMGFGFCYEALQLMSPTKFSTGTLVLCALFFYDIYFVFFTPMMITVAKSLDVPIKLVFPRPPGDDAPPNTQSLAMLGLGDIVLPGIMIGLALRFDLFMFYLKKQTRQKSPKAATSPDSDSSSKDSESDQRVSESSEHINDNSEFASTNVHEAEELFIVKAPFISVASTFGGRFWSQPIFWTAESSDYNIPGAFPKPYFNASIGGYICGMVCTLVAMQISDHPQPALLYLVPGVLLSLWGAGLVRGELKEMWNFSDAREEELSTGKDGNVENHRNDQVKEAKPDKIPTEKEAGPSADKTSKDGKDRSREVTSENHAKGNKKSSEDEFKHTLVAFSIDFPPPKMDDLAEQTKDQNSKDSGQSSSWQASNGRNDGHADKRQKVR